MSVMDLFRLDGKVVIVTGASSGLGVAFAHCFAEASADVVLGARRVEKLERVADSILAARLAIEAVRHEDSERGARCFAIHTPDSTSATRANT